MDPKWFLKQFIFLIEAFLVSIMVQIYLTCSITVLFLKQR